MKYGIWTSAKAPVVKRTYLKYVLLALALLAAYALGRLTHSHGNADCDGCLGEYRRGFDAGLREASAEWSEWK